ncbi:MAG: 4-(cytidine 5'-diphospho)-2-C-methyl-D-erythritol kinase [Actinobacteria bacterium]|uniref:4-(cytidine 5'-diphospho)-2-C-methyl-D-erythritol kinase n=1 Tax=freshwater metagenome TaxID=449393 RepID=A0A6J6Z6Q1_9ZZZZ|nr:4-(cytidine 5'-diphospho)-2-C-methyl-D-erythritol kinase [Actinomycetota bacterium]MSW21764.1 4-(cytidine 5'-diphospho)-2-C-methyl-D-erythritol kinase [Actinomycetota bacterium]MSX03574.1 4-(cytidine 5'-diphospho)-2-C-methyl-D-erythritol kinase [Actinomycetota bacterium]MSX83914.1 4-(cytidine 5'-diphospho)-2-C-methyl-D-erythritol kinase [Actinomycetota bacterium]MSY96394.1 4-(cytidine 5'-diphospho)-2-C-methyl-D-erythritol kinase [Actinomycetota bacterium]
MSTRGVVVRVPAKINLQLAVGPLGSDGFHEVTTVFQAISLFDDVSIKFAPEDSGIALTLSGATASGVPVDDENLAVRAAKLMVDKFDLTTNLAIHLKKEIPVAGGMAGGSADAAGIIVAMDSLFDIGLSRDEMEAIASQLGSDVPFGISGGVAIGRGRGDQLTPALNRGNYHWVLALSGQGLSTPAVYQECDRLREGLDIANPQVSDSMMQALRAGDATALGMALSNDLQAAACSLRPALRLVLDVGRDYGALGGIVSGSGPTVAFLVEDEEKSMDLTVALSSSGVVAGVVRASGPVHGARVIETL